MHLCQNISLYNANVHLVNDNVYTELSNAPNLRKMIIYNTNVDLVNNNVHTKSGLNKSICSQDIEQKQNSGVNQGP